MSEDDWRANYDELRMKIIDAIGAATESEEWPSVRRLAAVLEAEGRDLEQEMAPAPALVDALEAVLKHAEEHIPECLHEDTHRGGAIWEICDQCGAKWADDEGGRPEWKEPPEWAMARAALTAAKGE